MEIIGYGEKILNWLIFGFVFLFVNFYVYVEWKDFLVSESYNCLLYFMESFRNIIVI